MAQLIDGKAIAQKVRAEVAQGVARLKATKGIVPGLSVIRVGEDPASKIYVGSKRKAAAEAGFDAAEHHFPESARQAEVLEKVRALEADTSVHGILIQLPLPKHLDSDALIGALPPEKDVDGLHPVNAGKLLLGRPGPKACTPHGIMRLLDEIGVDPLRKRAVVVGRSNIVGKPMALMLLARHATVTLCHSKSDLAEEVPRADILVAAVGVPELIRGSWIKEGATVIDVGQNRSESGKLLGDVAFAEASERAAWITPVPGGVGPMTVAMLLQNTLEAAQRAG